MGGGNFNLGSLSKQTWTRRDWWTWELKNQYTVQLTSLKEGVQRGHAKCQHMPGLDNSTNVCSRFNMGYQNFFVVQAYTFGSVYNGWPFFALLSVLATQLNNLNLVGLFFPYHQDKAREVSSAFKTLSCGRLKSTHHTQMGEHLV